MQMQVKLKTHLTTCNSKTALPCISHACKKGHTQMVQQELKSLCLIMETTIGICAHRGGLFFNGHGLWS